MPRWPTVRVETCSVDIWNKTNFSLPVLNRVLLKCIDTTKQTLSESLKAL
jgi:hypothetical protein